MNVEISVERLTNYEHANQSLKNTCLFGFRFFRSMPSHKPFQTRCLLKKKNKVDRLELSNFSWSNNHPNWMTRYSSRQVFQVGGCYSIRFPCSPTFTDWIYTWKNLCYFSKYTMKHMHKLDINLNLPWFSYGYWHIIFIDSYATYLPKYIHADIFSYLLEPTYKKHLTRYHVNQNYTKYDTWCHQF